MAFGRFDRGVVFASALCAALLLSAGELHAAFPEFIDPNPAIGNQFGRFVVALSTGNVVIVAPGDDFAATDAGAAYLFNGATGELISTLRGSSADDQVGSGGVTTLTNGNYVVKSPTWDNGAVADAGALTWGSGITGVSGTVSAANSLVGSTAFDRVGFVTALTNGNYVVLSDLWDNGAAVDAGAVSWGSGTTGVTGTVSAANSLVGSNTNDLVGYDGVLVLPNGNYVVKSPRWDKGAVADAGAATWGNGTTGVIGTISAANSLVGSTAFDYVGSVLTALTNGNYLVLSPYWDNGAVADLGAVTWGSGNTGVIGTVSAANSLVGSTAGDYVGFNGVTTLSNGNYVVLSPGWDNGTTVDAGATTWGSGTTGVSGTISAANSLVGSTADDHVGAGGVTPLTNGNYVVVSHYWYNGSIPYAGAVTWGNGTTGVRGTISAANSLVGSNASNFVGGSGVTALTNGNYVVSSHDWANGTGAVTWGNGTTGVSGTVSAANSLVGSNARLEGGSGVTALTNGNYVVLSPRWDNGGLADAGAVTWGNGTIGVTGPISAANSLVGSTTNDGDNVRVTALSSGDYVVVSPSWDNGGLADAGAATWGNRTRGVSGTISGGNSLVGTTAQAGLPVEVVVEDTVNRTFLARFLTEGGGRVRVGAPDASPMLVSATDIPNDQGGWLRVTFGRSFLDGVSESGPVATYGVWRHVPGTIAARADRARASGALNPPPVANDTERLRSLLVPGLETREVEGRLMVMGTGSRSPWIAAAFPPGTWELVTSVPAIQIDQYVVAVPTMSNGAPNDYVVTAHTTTPSTWYISGAMSGQSVDNLAPAQPTGLAATYAGGQANLQWAANTEHDLASYRLYRGGSADFTPSPGNQIAAPTSTSYADVSASGGYYKLSAVDVNGNESGFALATAVAFALEGARPNPTGGSALHVAFALPSGESASLELLDVGGRRVLTREVGSLGAGRHTVNLTDGQHVPAGIYWLSLSQGGNQKRVRVAVIQ